VSKNPQGFTATPLLPVKYIPYKDLSGWLSIREALAVVVLKTHNLPEHTTVVDEIADEIRLRLKT
jgi:hypothetical protein